MVNLNARKAEFELKYNGKNISQNLAPYLLSVAYTDNASGKADNLTIQLEDKKGLWRGSWYPTKGATIEAAIVISDFERTGERKRLPCGIFQIDEIELSGPPSIVNIKCVSTYAAKIIVQTLKNRAWEGVSLKDIASDIANLHEFDLFFEANYNPIFERRKQIEMSIF